jgi:hypothetical protein
MNKTNLSRRAVLKGGTAVAAFCILGAASMKAGASGGESCADPSKLRSAEKSLRESLEYTPESSDSRAVCDSCAFFEPSGDDTQCGKCAIVNGVVDATGHCVSWSPKG